MAKLALLRLAVAAREGTSQSAQVACRRLPKSRGSSHLAPAKKGSGARRRLPAATLRAPSPPAKAPPCQPSSQASLSASQAGGQAPGCSGLLAGRRCSLWLPGWQPAQRQGEPLLPRGRHRTHLPAAALPPLPPALGLLAACKPLLFCPSPSALQASLARKRQHQSVSKACCASLAPFSCPPPPATHACASGCRPFTPHPG